MKVGDLLQCIHKLGPCFLSDSKKLMIAVEISEGESGVKGVDAVSACALSLTLQKTDFNALHSGYVNVQSRKLARLWKRRWMVLADNTLYIFENHTSNEACSWIDLEQSEVTPLSSNLGFSFMLSGALGADRMFMAEEQEVCPRAACEVFFRTVSPPLHFKFFFVSLHRE